LSGIKKLAGQTAIYGLSTVLGRFLNVFITFWLTHIYGAEIFGVFTLAYAYVTFLNVIFTYGFETAYFRFIQRPEYKDDVFNTSMLSVILTTIVFTGAMLYYTPQIADLWKIPENSEYVTWFAWIIGMDTLAAIPFARLRQQGKSLKYAAIKLLNIFIYVGITYFFISLAPDILAKHPDSFLLVLYDPGIQIGYAFIANLVASAVTLLLLYREILSVQLKFNYRLWKEMMLYSWPLLIVGLGGMINEVLNRILLDYRLPYSFSENKRAVGIFNANFKVAALVNIFIQVFRTGAEPFFFNEAGKDNARQTYARVMKFFVMISCIIFLVVALFGDTIWGIYFVGTKNHPEYAEGLGVIPVIALSYVFLGIYYNLTVWYKLTDKTIYGAYITLTGAVITILLNYYLIPVIGYWGSAWATLACYGFMMVISYWQGQKHYPIPYALKKLTAYIVIAIIVFMVYYFAGTLTRNHWVLIPFAILLTASYCFFLSKVEHREFSRLPFIGKFFKPGVKPVPVHNQASDNMKA
jgi:O-antigen/teichoic acid export membrane protein